MLRKLYEEIRYAQIALRPVKADDLCCHSWGQLTSVNAFSERISTPCSVIGVTNIRFCGLMQLVNQQKCAKGHLSPSMRYVLIWVVEFPREGYKIR